MSGHANTIRRSMAHYLSGPPDNGMRYREGLAALDALEAERDRLRDAVSALDVVLAEKAELRAERDAYKKDAEALIESREQYRAERDRLRDALQAISERQAADSPFSTEAEIARAALSEGTRE